MNKSSVALVLALILALIMVSTAANACGTGNATKYSTKTYIRHGITLSYTSYKGTDTYLVKDGKIKKTSFGKRIEGIFNVSLYDKNLSRLDGGRTYEADTTYTFNLKDGTLKSSTGSVEFYHIKTNC